MTWYKITYKSGRTEYVNDDDPVNRNMIEVHKRNMRTNPAMRGVMGGDHPGNPAKIERSSEAAARRGR